MSRVSVFAVAVLALVRSSTALDICGNFCGPTWCNKSVTPECAVVSGGGCQRSPADCNERGETDGSCADACCKAHDQCCGSTDRRPCNNAIIACLQRCRNTTGMPHCYHDFVPVPVDAILAGMELNPNECCGTSCGFEGSTKDYVREK
eukprot:m.36843 g.36843  ORF g.36843 m.36843 type:complete len:148 (+) comp14535_c0_seq1:57-500(+)